MMRRCGIERRPGGSRPERAAPSVPQRRPPRTPSTSSPVPLRPVTNGDRPPVGVPGSWSTTCCDGPVSAPGPPQAATGGRVGRPLRRGRRDGRRDRGDLRRVARGGARALAAAGIERRPAKVEDASARRRRGRGLLRGRAAVAAANGQTARRFDATGTRRLSAGRACCGRRFDPSTLDRRRFARRYAAAPPSPSWARVRPHPAPGDRGGPHLRAAADGCRSRTGRCRSATANWLRWSAAGDSDADIAARYGVALGPLSVAAARAACCDRRRTRCARRSAGTV